MWHNVKQELELLNMENMQLKTTISKYDGCKQDVKGKKNGRVINDTLEFFWEKKK